MMSKLKKILLVYQRPGMLEITTRDIKFNSDSHPLKLVYASSSFTEQKNWWSEYCICL